MDNLSKQLNNINSIVDLIGDTPLIKLNGFNGLSSDKQIFIKAEWFNPGGSIKDRAALSMIKDGINKKKLNSKKIIMDSSSGNTAIAYAMIGSALGFKVELVTPENINIERKKTLQAYGAKIIYSSPFEGSDGAILEARKMASKFPDKYFMPDQYNNEANPLAHYITTGPEIWDQTDGKVDGFVCASGTGGTIGGVSKFLKEKNKDIKIYLSDPTGSALYNHIMNGELKAEGGSITEGIGSSRITKNFAEAKIDGAFSISDQESLPILYDLIQNEGLSLGTSCGVNIAGAIRLGKELGPGKTIVTILCDKSDKYNSKMFNKSFLKEKKLPIPSWL